MTRSSDRSDLENTIQHGAVFGKTQTKQVKYYNLDAIIAVGYRVNSKWATQFRIWATPPDLRLNCSSFRDMFYK